MENTMTKETMAPKRFLRKWVAALRSGKYTQGTGRLKCSDGSLCCLGVACTVMAQETGKSFDSFAEESLTYPMFAGTWLFPKAIMVDLTNMNDGACGVHQKSFSEIADHIEATYLKEQNV